MLEGFYWTWDKETDILLFHVKASSIFKEIGGGKKKWVLKKCNSYSKPTVKENFHMTLDHYSDHNRILAF